MAPDLTSLEAPVLRPVATLRSDTLPVQGIWGARAEAATGPSASLHHPVSGARDEDWRRRLAPYVLGGAVVGGVAGYLYAVNFDRDRQETHSYLSAYFYPVMGVGVGGWTGALVGYLRERR